MQAIEDYGGMLAGCMGEDVHRPTGARVIIEAVLHAWSVTSIIQTKEIVQKYYIFVIIVSFR